MPRFGVRPGPAGMALDAAARACRAGLEAAFTARTTARLADRVAAIDPELAGFAWEGAGMGAGLVDVVTLSGGRRVVELLTGPAARYPYAVSRGVGRAYARLRLRPTGRIPAPDPILRWLAWDGVGFHHGIVGADRAIGGGLLEAGLTGVEVAIRDQGLGRALWFRGGADPGGVAARVVEFPRHRRANLWSGIGFAATDVGGATEGELGRLVELAGPYRFHVAQGAAFACKARLVGAIVTAHTELAARVLIGLDVADAAARTDRARVLLPSGAAAVTDYQRWRRATRHICERTAPISWARPRVAAPPRQPIG